MRLRKFSANILEFNRVNREECYLCLRTYKIQLRPNQHRFYMVQVGRVFRFC